MNAFLWWVFSSGVSCGGGSCANAVYMLQVEEQTCVFIGAGQASKIHFFVSCVRQASGKATTAKQPSSLFPKVRAWSDFAVRAAVAKSAFFRR